MKNLFLVLAFTLSSTFTFANNSEPVDPPPFYGEITIKEAADDESTEFTVQFTDLKSFQEFDISQLPISKTDKCKFSIKAGFQTKGVLTVKKSIKYENLSCDNIEQNLKNIKKDIEHLIKAS